MDLKQIIADFAAVDVKIIALSPKPEMGDFCMPCFLLAKEMKKAPNIIAEELAQTLNLKGNPLIEKVESMGGYVNFFVNKKSLALKILEQEIIVPQIGLGKVVAIDYCSANLAKYLHIGHFSTTILGESIRRIYQSLGYKVVRINYLGDYGTPFGKMVVATKMWSSAEEIERLGVDKIQALYVEFSQNETPELMEKAREASKNIEEKCGEDYEIYQIIISKAIGETKDILSKFEIEFDDWNGESYYSNQVKNKAVELLESGIAEKSQNAVIVNLEQFNKGVCVIERADGGSMYITRDLCAVEDRYQKYVFDQMLYVVAVQQKLHFEQMFEICRLMGKKYWENLHHISFGMFSTPEGKIASRKGKQALIKDILVEGEQKAFEIIKERDFSAEQKQEIAKKVTRSSLAFSVLKVERARDKIFNINEAISFDGETAPYLQYTYARINSILKNYEKMQKNSKKLQKNAKIGLIFENYFNIFQIINNFPNTILTAQSRQEPSVIARELLDLAQDFNRLYNQHKFLDEEDLESTKILVDLCNKIKQIFELGLPLVVVDLIPVM